MRTVKELIEGLPEEQAKGDRGRAIYMPELVGQGRGESFDLREMSL